MFGKKQSVPNLPALRSAMLRQEEAEDSRQLFDELSQQAKEKGPAPKRENGQKKPAAGAIFTDPTLETDDYRQARQLLTELLMDKVDFNALSFLSEDEKQQQLSAAINSILDGHINFPLNAAQLALLKEQAVDDLLGFGPLEVLLSDPEVSDIMTNGHKMVYVEKRGKLLLSDVTFSSEKHLLNIIQKIVSGVGRRIDEASPMVDARMPDGSRFNAIIPPLALDGCLISIRKFKKSKMAMMDYVEYGSVSTPMARFLCLCGYIRLNIIVSGGTGSGKTTLLNALSGNIDDTERVITIEDAAELQMHQPHVLRLETRPANMEGTGEINQRQLVKNALRMRPDRIILGEIRGDEIIDMLAAMNTGHDGSMATIHANNPKDCLSRIENLVGMSSVKLSLPSLRAQISSAVHIIVQIARMRDGKRRITQIEEIVGLGEDGESIQTQTLFEFKVGPMDEDGVLTGEFRSTGIVPGFIAQAAYFGKEREMLDCIEGQDA